MKILIASGIYPPDIGGPATYLSQFTKFLLEQHCEIKVVTFSDYKGRKNKDGVEVFRVSRKYNIIIRFLKYFFYLWKFSKDINLIYLHDVSLVGIIWLLVNFFRKKKYIIRIGGDNIWEQAYQKGLTKDKYFDFHSQKLPSFTLKVKKIILKSLAKNSEKTIVPSNFLKRALEMYGISGDKIEVINNAINIDIQRDKSDLYSKIEKYKQEGNKIFISSGRLISLKNFDYLIDIFSNINNAKLLIIGNGPEKEKLEKLIFELKLDDRIILIDKINRDELLTIYSLSDAFILLSVIETFSFAALEALSSGTKVILSKVGALKEIFGEFNNKGVEFVDLNNKNKIINILNNIDDIQCISQERIFSLKNKYDYNKHANEVYNIILNCKEVFVCDFHLKSSVKPQK